MFEQLIDPEFTFLDDADVADIIGAQMAASSFLDDDGAAPTARTPNSSDTSLARAAFAAGFTDSATDHKTKVLALKTPAAIQHHVSMLSQYDWDFVEQAKELRGFVVSKLLDESKHPDARIRLRSLELIGKITEVAAFTERVQITKVDATTDELQERIRAKLASLLPKTIEVETVVAKPAP